MKKITGLIIPILVLAIVSCNDDSPITHDDPDSTSFLRVEVVDTDGQPVTDLRVRAWNNLSIDKVGPGGGAQASRGASVLSSTTFSFSVLDSSQVSILVFDVEGNFVDTLVDGGYSAGIHDVFWSATNIPSGIFECRMVADTFQASFFALLHRRGEGPENEDMGYTSPDGIFETDDSTRFPNTFELPPLLWTDAVAGSLGEFSILDSVTIRLTDTTSDLSQYYDRKIINGSNRLTLVWDTSQAIPVSPTGGGASDPILQEYQLMQGLLDSPDVSIQNPSSTVEWGLYQNYPNPFN